MEERFEKSLKALDDALKNMTDEEKEKYFPKEDPIPQGWVSIEEHLPAVRVCDFLSNSNIFRDVKVKDKDGNEFMTRVGDHHTWYYMMKEEGVTHWFNEECKDDEQSDIS